MGYIIIMAILLVVCGIAFLVGRSFASEAVPTVDPSDYRGAERAKLVRDKNSVGKIMMATSIVVFVLLGAFITVVRSFHSVPAGHVGVVYQFNDIVDQTEAGLVTTLPWQSLRQANVQVQRAHFPELNSFSQETQDVFMDATVNYRVDPKDIQDLYTEVGPDYFEKLVPTRVNQLFKDETVKYTAVQIAPNREQIRRNVAERLRTELARFSIFIEDLLIDNIRFSPEFTKAIENKQIATQDAQTARNRVEQARQEAQQLIEKAQGEAAAYRLRQRNLTPLLVQQNAIDKLNPNVELIILPSGSNFLLPSELLARGTQGGQR